MSSTREATDIITSWIKPALWWLGESLRENATANRQLTTEVYNGRMQSVFSQ